MRFEVGRKLLAHRLVFVGHVSVDKIENINGARVQPGGAALYAAMAARTLSTNVTLISAIGKDYDLSLIHISEPTRPY